MASFRPSYCTISTYHRLITCLQVGVPLQPVRTGRDAGPAAAAWSAGRDRSGVLPSHKSRGCALDLGGLTCDGDVFLNGEFHADGQVRLTRATIQRELNCSKGTFSDLGPFTDPRRSPRALDAEGLTTAGSVYLNEVRTDAEVFLFRSQIAQHVDFAGVGSAGDLFMQFDPPARHPVCGPSRPGSPRHDLPRLIWLVAAVREESWSWSRGGEARAAGHRSAYWAPMLSALLVTE